MDIQIQTLCVCMLYISCLVATYTFLCKWVINILQWSFHFPLQLQNQSNANINIFLVRLTFFKLHELDILTEDVHMLSSIDNVLRGCDGTMLRA